jgi:hypothetical protein
MITLLHFLQRILKVLPRTFSSAMEYLALHLSHSIFMREHLAPTESDAMTMDSANRGASEPTEV